MNLAAETSRIAREMRHGRARAHRLVAREFGGDGLLLVAGVLGLGALGFIAYEVMQIKAATPGAGTTPATPPTIQLQAGVGTTTATLTAGQTFTVGLPTGGTWTGGTLSPSNQFGNNRNRNQNTGTGTTTQQSLPTTGSAQASLTYGGGGATLTAQWTDSSGTAQSETVTISG
jgi:hypothetical protein